jgi:cyclopropane-fatty-acyl-phospholipid synthase
MSFPALAISLAEHVDLPDALLRAGIASACAASARKLAESGETDADFAAAMATRPIASHAAAANAQHYELPAAFFAEILGTHRKYSSCLYPTGSETLDQAERAALEASCLMADLADGQRILELGCGWGSFCLFLAAKFPRAEIQAVSNSASQRAYIEAEAAARRLGNLEVVTADMNDFAPAGRFDRIVSVEMFEHMANWGALLARLRGWLEPDGRLFIHVFTHASTPYCFDHEHGADWIAQHFFTGGIMPNRELIRQFGDIFAIEDEQYWPGTHYQQTALHWLANFDRHQAAIMKLLQHTYGDEAGLWRRRWRLFFLAVAGLFGHAGGSTWGISQYRLTAVDRQQAGTEMETQFSSLICP